MHAQETTLVDPPHEPEDEVEDEPEDGLEDELEDKLDPLRAVCDCCVETSTPLLVVGTFLEVKGIVVVVLMTNPDSPKLIVSPSTTCGGPPTEMVWPEIEKALSPAVAVKIRPSTLNSMLIPVAPVTLVGVGTAEAIDLDAVLDGTTDEVVADVIDVEAMVSGKAVYEVAAGDAGVVEP